LRNLEVARGAGRTRERGGGQAPGRTRPDRGRPDQPGYPGASPSTKYAKGIQTIRAVGNNRQLAFDFGDLFAEEDPWDSGDRLATWLLLYHVTSDQVRAELSLANGIDRRGHVSEWIERIILPALRRSEC
jgi:hypothetical protein